MTRIHLRFPAGTRFPRFKSNDLVHDALLAGLRATGLASERMVGHEAEPFTFATHAFVRGHELALTAVTISTSSDLLGQALLRLHPFECRHWRAHTGEELSLDGAILEQVPCPIVSDRLQAGFLALSPIVLTDPADRGRWLDRFDPEVISAAINRRLSRLAGRATQLKASADALFLRLNPRPRRRVVVKIHDGIERYVFGLAMPVVLEGPTEDLRLAWMAGVGEKTRMGFGCLDLAEHGLSGRAA